LPLKQWHFEPNFFSKMASSGTALAFIVQVEYLRKAQGISKSALFQKLNGWQSIMSFKPPGFGTGPLKLSGTLRERYLN
jgi:hypothetical protein